MKKFNVLVLAGVVAASAEQALAVMLYGVPGGNTVPLSDSTMWNSVGYWQNAGGVVIGSQYFITAQHLFGVVGGTFSLTTTVGNVTTTNSYTTNAEYDIPNTDLVVFAINGTFPATAIAPLYSGTDAWQVGQNLSLVGYGYHTQGAAIVTGGVTNGWYWSGSNTVKNIGNNTVAMITQDGFRNSNTLDFFFNPALGANTGMYADKDSGSGAFIFNDGQWQLAGIGYGISEYFTETSPGVYALLSNGLGGLAFDAAIYNGTNLYYQDDSGDYLPVDSSTQYQEGYASDIVPYISQIDAIVPEPASASLLVISGTVLLGRRRRKMTR